MGAALQRIGQPAVMGQLIAGILLGPSVFGAIWPEAQRAVFAANPQQKSMIDGVSQLGILMLLLLTGMETDLRLVKQAGRAAISASIAGIAVPFACGFALGELLPAAMLPKPDQRIITSLFLGTALSIASLKIVAMHHGQPPRSSDRPQPAQSELRCRSAQSGLACRHNLCANLGRLALSGRRARSFHQEDRRLGDARSHAGGTDDRSTDHGHPAAKSAAWLDPSFRSRQPICCR